MIQVKLRVVTTDGPQGEFIVSPKVQVEFERQFKTGIGKAFENDLEDGTHLLAGMEGAALRRRRRQTVRLVARRDRHRRSRGRGYCPFRRDSLTYTVAAVAVATGIAPQHLLEDQRMLEAILAVLKDQAKEAEKAKAKKR